MARPLYFDCDTGIDDSVALAYLLASPEVDLVGIGTVSGNVSSAT
ncbi:MAG: nucleoside hydrolase, partial [Actinobacteria bacterium]|nr:nucleoside hydrolase [Actinomycetota bacterium]